MSAFRSVCTVSRGTSRNNPCNCFQLAWDWKEKASDWHEHWSEDAKGNYSPHNARVSRFYLSSLRWMEYWGGKRLHQGSAKRKIGPQLRDNHDNTVKRLANADTGTLRPNVVVNGFKPLIFMLRQQEHCHYFDDVIKIARVQLMQTSVRHHIGIVELSATIWNDTLVHIKQKRICCYRQSVDKTCSWILRRDKSSGLSICY